MKKKSKLITLEINEVPPFLLNAYIKQNPQSHLATLFHHSAKFVTLAEDANPNHLYPAQTWASINSGIAYSQHQVFRYNDPKEKAPQIWDILANKYSVGVVNSIHSSAYKNKSKMQYFVSDPYTKSTKTIPKNLKHFQRFKIRQTFSSGRVAKYKISFKDCIDALFFIRFVSFNTLKESFTTVFNAFKGKHKERLRNIEFLLHADIFLKLMKKKDSEINVFFTNHIASQMHRYLGAQFPNDYIISQYGNDWINEYKNECNYAIDLLDKFIGNLTKRYTLEHNRYILCSGMGQMPIQAPQANQLTGLYINQPEKFWKHILPSDYSYKILGAMVPQLTIELKDSNTAINAQQYISQLILEGFSLYIERKANILTVSFRASSDSFAINNHKLTITQIGATYSSTDKANTGKHMPRGMLWICGKNIEPKDYKSINYLSYVDLVKQTLNYDATVL